MEKEHALLRNPFVLSVSKKCNMELHKFTFSSLWNKENIQWLSFINTNRENLLAVLVYSSSNGVTIDGHMGYPEMWDQTISPTENTWSKSATKACVCPSKTSSKFVTTVPVAIDEFSSIVLLSTPGFSCSTTGCISSGFCCTFSLPSLCCTLQWNRISLNFQNKYIKGLSHLLSDGKDCFSTIAVTWSEIRCSLLVKLSLALFLRGLTK